MKIKKEYKKRINILFAGIIELSLFLKMNLYFQLLIYSSHFSQIFECVIVSISYGNTMFEMLF